MNIYQHNGRRRPDWVKLYFEVGLKKPALEQFDNFEVKPDILPQLQHAPQIFKSAGGIATALAMRQPRRVVISIQTYYNETVVKLERISKYIGGRYSLTLEINGYYDRVYDVVIDPGLGASLNTPVLPGTLPNVGRPVMINGSGPVIMTQDQYDSWGGVPEKWLVEVPFQMKAVIEHSADWHLPGQARAIGPRRNETVVFTLHESLTLALPKIRGAVIDIGQDEGTGILAPELPD
jgi:hypothetical protein